MSDLTGLLLGRNESRFGKPFNRSPHHEEPKKTLNSRSSLGSKNCHCCSSTFESNEIKQGVLFSPACLNLKLCLSLHPCQTLPPSPSLSPSLPLPHCETFCSNTVDLLPQSQPAYLHQACREKRILPPSNLTQCNNSTSR